MSRESLQLTYATRPPTLDDIRVFDSLTRRFLGTEFTFRVIGSSHYISAPAYEFYELAACDPAPPVDRGGTTIPLEPDRSPSRLVFENDALRCVTRVEHRPLSAFRSDRSGPQSVDLAHTFDGASEAVTTIEIDEDGYETYHTYPEFDLALYTRTVFTRVRRSSTLASATRATDSPRQSRDRC